MIKYLSMENIMVRMALNKGINAKIQSAKKLSMIFSKSPVSSSKKGLDKWLLYAQCMINGNTIRQCAEIVEINIATAFFWRHKIIDAIRKFIGYGSLEGVIELDETYFALSYKGNHSKSSNFTMPRESRKRGKEINTRGISKEFACVLCGVDRLGNIYTGLICDGRPNYTDINRLYQRLLKKILFYVLINIGVISHLRLNIILNYIKLGAGEKLWIFIIFKESMLFIVA